VGFGDSCDRLDPSQEIEEAKATLLLSADRAESVNVVYDVGMSHLCPSCDGPKDVRSKLCRGCYLQPATAETKRCSGCRLDLPISSFRVRTRKTPRPRSRCKSCETQEHLARCRKDPEARRAAKRRWAAKNPESVKRSALRSACRRMGFSEDVVSFVLLRFQETDACDICHRTDAGTLHVEHCHATKAFRGLVCEACNHGIGKFGDDPERLRAAADYLERARSEPGNRGSTAHPPSSGKLAPTRKLSTRAP